MVRAVLALGLVTIGVAGWVASVPAQGVAGTSAPAVSEAEVLALKERAAAFWAARVAGDLETQWQFLEPRWQGRMTAAEYGLGLTGGRWLAYRVEDARVNGFFATVKVRLLVQQNLPASSAGRVRMTPQGALVDDGWVRIGGVWFRRLEGADQAPSQSGQP
jgi:hypothetical protein